MAPLAPKPPFATDQPDSFYEKPQPPRLQLPPPDPNQRSSAYNLYDNYLSDEPESVDNNHQVQPSPDRSSGIGALGMGLLNMEDSDSEDEDEDDIQRKPNSPPGLVVSGLTSKHAVLAATISPIRANFPPVPVQQQRPQQLPTSQVPSSQPSVTVQIPSQPASFQSAPNPHVPQPIAAPRPGYAAPIAALNLARAEPSATPVGRMPNPNSPLPLVNNPFEPPRSQPRPQYPMPVSPVSPTPSTPHPLHPSVTPITPAFIRPSKSPALQNEGAVNVKFSEGKAIPRKPIMRGNSEETLLPGRGEKGDDFWRRFSMVAKNGSERKESSWLHKMRNSSNRQARMVWCTAILVLLLIAGGIFLGLFLSRKAPSNQAPVALGGSADSLSTTVSSSSVISSSTPAQPSQTSFHVTPTYTLNNREPDPSPLVIRLAQHLGMQAAR